MNIKDLPQGSYSPVQASTTKKLNIRDLHPDSYSIATPQTPSEPSTLEKIGQFIAPTATGTIKKLAGGESVSGRDILGSALEVGSFVLPVGAVARGAGLAAKGIGLAAKGLGRKALETGVVGAATGALSGAGKTVGEGGTVGDIAGSALGGAVAGGALGSALPVGIAAVRGIPRATKAATDITKMATGGLARTPGRIATNIEAKQAEQATIKALPTKTAQRAAQNGIDPMDIKTIYSVPTKMKPYANELVNDIKKFANREKGASQPIETVGKPIVEGFKKLESIKNTTGKKLGEVSKKLGIVTSQELEKPVFTALSKSKGLEGLRVKNGQLDFKNTVLAMDESAPDRAAIQSIYSQATKWGNGEAKHKMRQSLFEILGGKKGSLQNMTGTQENAFNAIRKGLSDVLDAKNPLYKQLNKEYAESVNPYIELRKILKETTGMDEDVLSMNAGLIASRLTGKSLSQGAINTVLRSMDKITKGSHGKTAKQMQDLYNVLGRYYDIEPKTGFQGGIKAGVEGATGLGDLITGAVKGAVGQTPAVRQKAIEDALKEAFGGYLPPKPAKLRKMPTTK